MVEGREVAGLTGSIQMPRWCFGKAQGHIRTLFSRISPLHYLSDGEKAVLIPQASTSPYNEWRVISRG